MSHEELIMSQGVVTMSQDEAEMRQEESNVGTSGCTLSYDEYDWVLADIF